MKNFLRLLLPLLCASAIVHAAEPMVAASPETAKPLAVGAAAPALTLLDMEGQEVDLGAAFAEKPTILVFYRGSWCPFCNRQLAALGDLEPKLLALGYQIIAISPDTAEGLKKMAGKNHLDYRLLSDRPMLASLAYGTAFRVSPEMEKAYHGYGIDLTPLPDGSGKWLPVPTVFIVNRAAKIQFVFSNPDYKVRLANDDLLAAAQAAAK